MLIESGIFINYSTTFTTGWDMTYMSLAPK